MDVVKARIQMDVLLPKGEAQALERMSLEQVMARIQRGSWLAKPLVHRGKEQLTEGMLQAEIAGMRASGCKLDDAAVAAVRGTPNWWDGISSLEDMIRLRDTFLADPGCDVDVEGIAGSLGRAGEPLEGDERAALLRDHFSALVSGFDGRKSFAVHRHMRVEDTDDFLGELCGAVMVEPMDGGSVQELIEQTEDEFAATGAHWSLNRRTSRSLGGLDGEDVILVAEVPADGVDWFPTFQAAFSHPHENAVVPRETPNVTGLIDVYAQEVHEVGEPAAPAPGR